MSKCESCEKEKEEKEFLPGIPRLCLECFQRINGVPPKMPPVYYEGVKHGIAKGTREERNRLRKILFQRGTEDLIEAVLKR